jgi:hypothetical protein
MAAYLIMGLLVAHIVGLACCLVSGLKSGFRQEMGTIAYLVAVIIALAWGVFHV